MIPRLFEKNTGTTFSGFGICSLPDCIRCTVTEERNGEYTLAMTYPRSGQWAEEIEVGRIIFVRPNENAAQGEPFRIFEVVFDLNGDLSVSAEHISYMLNHIIVGSYQGTTRYPWKAWNELNEHLLTSNPFTFNTDISDDDGTVYTFGSLEPAPLRRLIGGTETSLLELYGGELYWNQYTVNLLANRGSDKGVKISYSKNLTGLKYDVDISEVFDAVVAYYKSNDTYVEGTVQTQAAAQAADYGFSRVKVVDASSDFKDTVPTAAELDTWAAAYLAANATGAIVSVDVDFVPLWQTEEYKQFSGLEYVDLCDTVEVLYPPMNLSISAKVVKTVYNVLSERYDRLTISTIKPTLADTIFGLMERK